MKFEKLITEMVELYESEQITWTDVQDIVMGQTETTADFVAVLGKIEKRIIENGKFSEV